MSVKLRRLLVLTSTYPRWADDVEPGFVHLLNKEIKARFEIHVLCPHFNNSRKFEIMDGIHIHRYRYQFDRLETLISEGGIISNLKKNPLKWLLVPFLLVSQVFSLLRLTRSLKPDVIHIHWVISQGLAYYFLSLFLKMPPAVLTSHGGDLYSLNNIFFLFFKRQVFNKVNKITVVSQQMKAVIQDMGVPSEKIIVRSMGVDFSTLFKTVKQVSRNDKQLLFVGRLVEKKGLTYLLDAIKKVREYEPEVKLLIVGDGPEKEALNKKVHALGLQDSIQFEGAVAQKQLSTYYQNSALFIAPFIIAASGDQEGLGLVTLEAIGCGTPVLVGDVPAVRDLFPEGADELLDPRDINTFSNKILNVLDHPQEYRVKSSALRETVLNQYSWPVVGKAYGAILNSVCSDAEEI